MNTELMNEQLDIVEVIYRQSKSYDLARPFYDATMGPFSKGQLASITIIMSDGSYGEAPIMVRQADDLLKNHLCPILLKGKNSYENIYKELYWTIRNFGFRSIEASAIGAIDLAFHDYFSKKKNLPLHRMLGANQDSCPFYGSGGSIHLSDGELFEELDDLLSLGVKQLKIKVQPCQNNFDKNVKRVELVRQHIGKSIKLAVDSNQLCTPEEALLYAQAIEPYKIEWFEEPVHSADLIELKEICQKSPINIAVGESERCGRVFPSIAEAGVDHLQPAPHKMASVKEWIDVMNLAVIKNLTLSSGGIAPLAAQLIPIANYDLAMTEYLAPTMSHIHEYLKVCPTMIDGHYHLNHEKGLGYQVDWELLRTQNMIQTESSYK